MRRGSIIWGGLLILLGLLFLLDNFDVININIWGLFWPLIFIWFGLQLLLGPRLWGGSAETQHLTIPIKEIEEAKIRVSYGAGELHIHGNSAPDELLDGSFGSGLRYDVKKRGSGVDIKMHPPVSAGPFNWPWWGSAENRNWSFGLNNSINLSLDINTGPSKAVLNLSDLKLTDLHLKTGMSETTVTLPAKAAYTKVRAETGMASVTMAVPDGVAARIRVTGGIADVRVDESRFPRSGGRYESVDYDTAENKVEINLTVGMGQATIR